MMGKDSKWGGRKLRLQNTLKKRGQSSKDVDAQESGKKKVPQRITMAHKTLRRHRRLRPVWETQADENREKTRAPFLNKKAIRAGRKY